MLWRTIQLIFSTQGYGGYCFSVRPKARTGKFIEKGNEGISKRHSPLCPAFLMGVCIYCCHRTERLYRAPVPSPRRCRTGRAILTKKKTKKRERTARARRPCFLGEYLGTWYIWMGKICRHVANGRQEKEYGAVILVYRPGQADITLDRPPVESYLLPGRATYPAKLIQNIQFYYCVHFFPLSNPRRRKKRKEKNLHPSFLFNVIL